MNLADLSYSVGFCPPIGIPASSIASIVSPFFCLSFASAIFCSMLILISPKYTEFESELLSWLVQVSQMEERLAPRTFPIYHSWSDYSLEMAEVYMSRHKTKHNSKSPHSHTYSNIHYHSPSMSTSKPSLTNLSSLISRFLIQSIWVICFYFSIG